MADNINFHYWTNLEKINDHIFQDIKKKNSFWPFLGDIFPNLGGQKKKKKAALSHTTSYGFLTVSKI